MAPDILLIEDDPDLREEVATFLRYSNFEVRECAGVAQAASAIRERRPDAALIDVEAHDGQAALVQGMRERQTDVAEADHADDGAVGVDEFLKAVGGTMVLRSLGRGHESGSLEGADPLRDRPVDTYDAEGLSAVTSPALSQS